MERNQGNWVGGWHSPCCPPTRPFVTTRSPHITALVIVFALANRSTTRPPQPNPGIYSDEGEDQSNKRAKCVAERLGVGDKGSVQQLDRRDAQAKYQRPAPRAIRSPHPQQAAKYQHQPGD